MVRNIAFKLCLLLAISFFWSCSSSQRMVQQTASLQMEPVFVPPAGVDSLTAREAASLAEELFVPYEEEEIAEQYKREGTQYVEKGDSLWKYLTMKLGEKIITPEDSQAFYQAYNEGALTLAKIIELSKKSAVDTAGLNQLLAEQARLLDNAQRAFENAIRHNPFDNDARNYLAYVYRLQAVRLDKEGNLQRVVEILERLTRLIRGEHTLFAKLGETYFAMEDWENSYNAFKEAERVLLETADLQFSEADTQSAGIDTTTWFQYVYYQGYNATNMRQADIALENLHRALTLATNEATKRTVRSVIDWINWDDGNIEASEERDRIFELEARELYQEAAQAYKALLPKLQTQRARDEIQWRLALIEFDEGTLASKESAVRRLQQIVDRLEQYTSGVADTLATEGIDMEGKYASDVYPDSLKQRYYDAYGTMLYNLGVQNIQQKSRRTAFTYFYKAANFPWNGRAKALLQVGVFSQNNPRKAIAYCEQAELLIDQLNTKEKRQLYSLLAQLYKQIGDFSKAREYFKLWKVANK